MLLFSEIQDDLKIVSCYKVKILPRKRDHVRTQGYRVIISSRAQYGRTHAGLWTSRLAGCFQSVSCAQLSAAAAKPWVPLLLSAPAPLFFPHCASASSALLVKEKVWTGSTADLDGTASVVWTTSAFLFQESNQGKVRGPYYSRKFVWDLGKAFQFIFFFFAVHLLSPLLFKIVYSVYICVYTHTHICTHTHIYIYILFTDVLFGDLVLNHQPWSQYASAPHLSLTFPHCSAIFKSKKSDLLPV